MTIVSDIQGETKAIKIGKTPGSTGVPEEQAQGRHLHSSAARRVRLT